MPTFYHYTDVQGAENIIRTGSIWYGNGVYLTALNPETSTKHQIAMNNWQNVNANTMKKLKNYFILDIPDSDIKDTNATGRNIFLFGHSNDLRLHKYKWVLKDYDTGITIASYKYQVTSSGPAAIHHLNSMGDYIMVDETVNGRPLYKGPKEYLFMWNMGFWIVGPNIGEDHGNLGQDSKYSLGPQQNLPWYYIMKYYGSKGVSTADDDTLKVTAYGDFVIVKTFNFEKI